MITENKFFQLVKNKDIYVVNYFGNRIEFTILICSRKTSSLDKEIELLSISQKDPIAIIPKTLISNDLQFIQGIIHYYVYRKDVRVFNEGLFLSMLIIGEKQFKDVVKKLNKEFVRNNDYYLVMYLNNEELRRKLLCHSFKNCAPYNVVIRFKNLGAVIKNIRTIIELL
ncbi:MAG: hypothetical protein J7J82_01980 [Staphylothermus sp.]|nr:hypothetical protein [Staphylothermus sp.]